MACYCFCSDGLHLWCQYCHLSCYKYYRDWYYFKLLVALPSWPILSATGVVVPAVLTHFARSCMLQLFLRHIVVALHCSQSDEYYVVLRHVCPRSSSSSLSLVRLPRQCWDTPSVDALATGQPGISVLPGPTYSQPNVSTNIPNLQISRYHMYFLIMHHPLA